jgi:hypothetical protein
MGKENNMKGEPSLSLIGYIGKHPMGALKSLGIYHLTLTYRGA